MIVKMIKHVGVIPDTAAKASLIFKSNSYCSHGSMTF